MPSMKVLCVFLLSTLALSVSAQYEEADDPTVNDPAVNDAANTKQQTIKTFDEDMMQLYMMYRLDYAVGDLLRMKAAIEMHRTIKARSKLQQARQEKAAKGEGENVPFDGVSLAEASLSIGTQAAGIDYSMGIGEYFAGLANAVTVATVDSEKRRFVAGTPPSPPSSPTLSPEVDEMLTRMDRFAALVRRNGANLQYLGYSLDSWGDGVALYSKNIRNMALLRGKGTSAIDKAGAMRSMVFDYCMYHMTASGWARLHQNKALLLMRVHEISLGFELNGQKKPMPLHLVDHLLPLSRGTQRLPGIIVGMTALPDARTQGYGPPPQGLDAPIAVLPTEATLHQQMLWHHRVVWGTLAAATMAEQAPVAAAE